MNLILVGKRKRKIKIKIKEMNILAEQNGSLYNLSNHPCLLFYTRGKCRPCAKLARKLENIKLDGIYPVIVGCDMDYEDWKLSYIPSSFFTIPFYPIDLRQNLISYPSISKFPTLVYMENQEIHKLPQHVVEYFKPKKLYQGMLLVARQASLLIMSSYNSMPISYSI